MLPPGGQEQKRYKRQKWKPKSSHEDWTFLLTLPRHSEIEVWELGPLNIDLGDFLFFLRRREAESSTLGSRDG